MEEQKSYTKADAKVMPCTCQHEFQDITYGKGRRVHNPCSNKAGGIAWRCTVCRSEKK